MYVIFQTILLVGDDVAHELLVLLQVTSLVKFCSSRMQWALHHRQCSAPQRKCARSSRGLSGPHGADRY